MTESLTPTFFPGRATRQFAVVFYRPPTPEHWRDYVTTDTSRRIKEVVNDKRNNFGRPPRRYKFAPTKESIKNCPEILTEIYEAEVRAYDCDDEAKAMRVKKSFYMAMVREMHRTRNYRSIPALVKEVEIQEHQTAEPVDSITKIGIQTLYLMSCTPPKFLVGVDKGPVWQDINIQAMKDPLGRLIIPVMHLSRSYLNFIRQISNEDRELVPRNLVLANALEGVQFPKMEKSLDEWLTDAYYNRRYTGPINGANIALKDAGDVRSVTMLQKGNALYSRVDTRFGDGLVVLDLEDGSWKDPVKILKVYKEGPDPTPSSWVTLVAKLYHDFVCAEELPIGKPRQFSGEVRSSTSSNNLRPSYQVLPRVIRVRDGNDQIRRSLTDSERPSPRPHFVIPYIRRGNMTDHQLQIIREWEKKTGVELPKRDGMITVRPHRSPREAEYSDEVYPSYVERIISTDLQKQIDEKLGRFNTGPVLSDRTV